MVITQHVSVRGTGPSSPPVAPNQLSGWDRLWITLAALTGLGVIPIGLMLLLFGKRRVAVKALKWSGVGFGICVVVVGLLVCSLWLLPASTTTTSVSQPVTVGGSALPSSALNLLPESQSDTPAQAAKELAHAWTYGYEFRDPAVDITYLGHAYVCRNASCGYSQAVTQVGQLSFAVGPVGPRVVVDNATSNADGSITATTTSYTIGAKVILTFTAEWTGSQWGATTLNLNYIRTAS
jgi:hypothetical protein